MGRCFWMRIKKLWDASSKPSWSGSGNALQPNWNHFVPMPANCFLVCLCWKVMQLVMNTLIGVWTKSAGSQLISHWFKVNENGKETREIIHQENEGKMCRKIIPFDPLTRHRKCNARWCLFIIYVLKFLLQFSIFFSLAPSISIQLARDYFSAKQFFSVLQFQLLCAWNASTIGTELIFALNRNAEKFPPDTSADLQPFGIPRKILKERRLNFTGKIRSECLNRARLC